MKYQDDQTPNSGSDSTGNQTSHNPIKKVLGVLIALAVLALIFYGAQALKKDTKPSSDYTIQEIENLDQEKQEDVLQDQLKDYEQRVADLNEQSSVSDRYVAYTRLADLQLRLKMYEEARESLSKVPPERGNSGLVYALYAKTYAGLGDKTQAQDYIKKALATSDDIADYWLVYLDLIQDMESGALNAIYFDALAKTSDNLDILKHFAQSLERRGDKAGAVTIWERAIKKDPANKATYEAEISRLKG